MERALHWNVSSKLKEHTYRFGKISWGLPAHLIINSFLPVSIFRSVRCGFGGKLTGLQMISFFAMKLTSSLVYKWDFFAGLMLLKLGGSSALSMQATRTTDAWHLKPCSKVWPRNTAINYRILYRCEPDFHSSKTTCYISMFVSWIFVLWLIKINTCLRVKHQLGSY